MAALQSCKETLQGNIRRPTLLLALAAHFSVLECRRDRVYEGLCPLRDSQRVQDTLLLLVLETDAPICMHTQRHMEGVKVQGERRSTRILLFPLDLLTVLFMLRLVTCLPESTEDGTNNPPGILFGVQSTHISIGKLLTHHMISSYLFIHLEFVFFCLIHIPFISLTNKIYIYNVKISMYPANGCKMTGGSRCG